MNRQWVVQTQFILQALLIFCGYIWISEIQQLYKAAGHQAHDDEDEGGDAEERWYRLNEAPHYVARHGSPEAL